MKLSIIIPTYDRSQSLKRTLGSVRRLEDRKKYLQEVLVVDNKGDEATRRVAEEAASQGLPVKYEVEKKKGKSFALNRGMGLAGGDIVAFIDDDCVFSPKWVKRVSEAFQKRSDCDLLIGKIFPLFEHKVPDWLDFRGSFHFGGPVGFFDMGDEFLDNRGEVLPTPGPQICVKNQALKKYGTFRALGRGEDIEFSYRWHRQGAVIVYSPDCRIYHCPQSELLTKSYFRRWNFNCGKLAAQVYYDTFAIGRTFWGVPLWSLRRVFNRVFTWGWHFALKKRDAFFKELRFYYQSGFAYGLRAERRLRLGMEAGGRIRK